MSARRKSEVSRALSHYLGLGARELFPRLELKRDLGLQPLDIVWFLSAFPEPDVASFPFEELAHVQLLGELVQLIASWLDDRDQQELLATDEELFGLGPQSGSRRVAHFVAAE